MKRMTLSIFFIVTLLAVLSAPVLAAETQQDGYFTAVDVYGSSAYRNGDVVTVYYSFYAFNFSPDPLYCRIFDTNGNSEFVTLEPDPEFNDFSFDFVINADLVPPEGFSTTTGVDCGLPSYSNTWSIHIVADTDGDGFADDVDNAPNAPNPDQSDLDGDGIGDVSDACPNDATNTCDPDGSAATYLDSASGGTLATADGTTTITIPPGAAQQDGSISITDTDDGSSGFELTTNLGTVFVVFSVDLQPSQTFNEPVSITFAWDDADNDGIVDGTNAKEENLIVTKDAVVITGQCKNEPDCDMEANTFTFEVSSWSEFALAYVNGTVPELKLVASDYNPGTGIWSDTSGSGNDGTAQGAPTLVTHATPSCEEIVRFNGTSDLFTLPDFASGFSAGEVFIVIKVAQDPPTSGGRAGIWTFGESVYGSADHHPWINGRIYDGFGSTTRKASGEVSANLNQYHIYNVISAPGRWENRINNQTLVTTNVNTVFFRTDPVLGRSKEADRLIEDWDFETGDFYVYVQEGSSYFLEGDIAEIRVYSGALSSGERDDIYNSLYTTYLNPDGDGDGVAGCDDNAPNAPNPDQSDLDGDGIGDVSDACPNDATDTCDPDGSAATYVDSESGGTLATADGTTTITIPPGAAQQDGSISITDTDDGSSGFELTTNLGTVLVVFSIDLQPSQTFNEPVSITFAWDDADNDGFVDGTNANEENLIVTKDAVVLTGQCKNEPANDGALPDCDMDANTFTFEVSSWSEFALAYAIYPVVAADSDLVAANEGDTAVNTGTVSDADGDTVTLTATVGLVVNNNDGTWSWSFATTDGPADIQTVTISANDGNGGTAETTFDLTVNNVNPSVAANAGTVTVNEGQTANNAGSYSDVPADTVSLSADVGSIVDNGSGAWSWSFDSTDGPTESGLVTITAQDEDGGSAIATFNLVVNNVAPTAVSLAPTTPDPVVAINTPVAFDATFTDPAGAADEDYACSFDWGGGGAVNQDVTAAYGSCSASVSYSAVGVYTVKLTVTDEDLADSDPIYYRYVVVYDPSAGFVTGGGWIWSPLGAYVAGDTLEGKASFGFVAKYKKGQSTPDGNTQFQFRAGDLNFHSDSYEWLVVAGANAKFMGHGTINGSGNYDFMLTATDGQINGGGGLDKFRIKIWDKDNGDAVVYDNQMDAGDDDMSAGTELGGGSIVIHNN